VESQELWTGLTGENQSSAQASDACSDRYFAPQIVMQVVAVVKDRFWISPKTAMPPKPALGRVTRVESRTEGAVAAASRWRLGWAFASPASIRFGLALFPVPAHRTGQADFPHPALGKDARLKRSM
jgi:hypothetical protein